ncbi:Hypothetical predicted protein [Cloeon dipterum]|uniref:Uncharacterized protein n=1 Tax=Cloeon dipterum TaxID=197152 RepID=A0A8S1DBY2_9INSE|nr:Hypothetical predicted protein [Cloeon dipterum]
MKRKNDDGSPSSKAGLSAPAKETGNDKKCLFCRSKVAKISRTLQRRNSRIGYVCATCGETESFTMEDLKEMTGADLAALKKCKALEKYEFPTDFDGSDIYVGYFEWKKCGICREILRKGDDVRDHNNDKHTHVQKCCLGCNQYSTSKSFESHKTRCGIFCPKCKVKPSTPNNDYRQHFMNELKEVFTCPADGCCKAFLRKDLNKICQHLLSQHVWRLPMMCQQRESSPVNKRRRRK